MFFGASNMNLCWQAALAALVAIVAGGACVLASDSGRGRHKQFYVVPTPGQVVVDGKLHDWDLSGQIEMFVVEATRATQNAKIAAMYDAEALYISGEIADPTPLMNRHDPKVDPHRGWDADALQFRLVLDPEAEYPEKENAFRYRNKDAPPDTRDDIVHLLLWYFTDDGSANLQMSVGMSYRAPRPEWKPHGLVPADKFAGAYRKWDNGRGYTFEYRIPWETLGAKRPLRAGDRVAGTMQVNWSRPDGLKTGGGSAWSYDVLGTPGFPFQSAACWGQMIFAEQGNVPKELVEAGVPPERVLPLEFTYDLPADSRATTIQLMDQDNRVVRIIVAQQERPAGRNVERWDGLDSRGNLLPAGEYHWRGICSAEPIRAEYRFSVHNSGQPAYPTDDNKGGWGSDHNNPFGATVIGDDMLLYWSGCEYGWGLIRVNADGRKQWGSKSFAKHLATDGERLFVVGGPTWHMIPGVHVLDASDSRPIQLANGQATLPPPPGGEEAQNEVTGLAWHQGKLYTAYAARDLIAVHDTATGELLASWQVPIPGRLAALPDGSLAVISQGQVLKVTEGAANAWISDNLDEPQGIAVSQDGAVYVSNQGRLHNVSVFDAQGKYLRSIGKPGGRPAVGAYDPSGMYMPGGIALDSRGRLWVAETTDYPKRFSVWDAKTGGLVNEFFGGSSYFAYGYIDPARPDEIYAHNVIWAIDWKKHTTRPKFTIWRQIAPDMPPAPNVDAHSGCFRLQTADNGQQFGYGPAGKSRSAILYLLAQDRFQPILGTINPWVDGFPVLDDLKAGLEAKWKADGLRDNQQPRGLFWQDANGDGRISPDEVSVQPGLGQVARINPDLSLIMSSGRRLRPIRVDATGRPVYDPTQAEDTAMKDKLAGFYIISPDQGAFVLNYGREDGTLTRWSATGEREWYFSGLIKWQSALNLPTVGPGRLWAMTRPMGVAGGVIAFQTYFGACQLFRADGMYVGMLLQDGRNQPSLGAHTGQPEGQGGSFVELEIDGAKRIFMIHGGQDVRVWEVLGLDAIQDLPGGVYVHTEEMVAKARAAKQDYDTAMGGKEIVIVRGRKALASAKAVGKRLEDGRGFEARVAYDDKNLYCRFDVTAPHGLQNGQANPQIIFRGGNCLDIQLAADSKADPNRDRPAPGDLRLLVTRKNEKPFAVLFRPRLAGFASERIALVSPTGKEEFDAISEVEVELEYEKTDTGFIATVTVPLETIGFQPKPGQKVRMDLGYIFGNSEGTRTIARAYANNNSFSANVVDDIPNESRLEPKEWGEATVAE